MKSAPSINKINAELVASLVLVAILSLVYVWIFIDLLVIGETDSFGFTGILIPDTFVYRFFYDDPEYFALLDSGIKNSIGPALLWKILGGNWYIASAFNAGMLFFTVVFLNKIAAHIGISISKQILFFLVLLPETFIYTVGVLKEIPTLLVFSALSFFFLKKRWFLFIFCFSLLCLFRYQFSIVVAFFLSGHLVFGKKNIRFLALAFVITSSLYPLLIQYAAGINVQDGILYRENAPGLGIGGFVQSVQTEWYGLSALATLVRIFQMLIEPWPTPPLFEGPDLNISILILSISAVMLIPVWLKYFRFLFYALRYPNSLGHAESVILCMSFVFLMMVGLNGFIHHRYLYAGLGLFLLVAYFPIISRHQSTSRGSPGNLLRHFGPREIAVESEA